MRARRPQGRAPVLGSGCRGGKRRPLSPSRRAEAICRRLGVELHLFHFLDIFDGDGAGAIARIHRSADAHKFSQERHELVILTGVRHGGGHGRVDVAFPRQNDQRRAAFRAFLRAFEVEIGGGSFVILNGAGDIADQAFYGGFVLGGGFFGVARRLRVRCCCSREGDAEEKDRLIGCT